MRRGGVLILLIGLILVVGAGALFFLFRTPTGVGGPGAPTVIPTEDPGVQVIVARVDIPANTLIGDAATLLAVKRIPTAEYDSRENYTSVADVQGKLALSPINRDEVIRRASLTEPGLSQQIPTAEPDRPRPKAYAFQVNSLTGVADQIKPGDFIDVVATFRVLRRVVEPVAINLEEQAGQTVPVVERNFTEPEFVTTKTIIQQAQVLRIQRQVIATADGTPTPEAQAQRPPATTADGQPATGGVGGDGSGITPGNWLLVLSINDQEAELIEFALNTNARISLVLRGAGDTVFEPTIGATFDLLVSEFGLPLPRPLPPRVFGEDEMFIPNPTQTPAPTRVP